MSGAWAAGTTRARAMLTRCAGPRQLRRVAASSNLGDAVRLLGESPYRSALDRIPADARSLSDAQRAIAETLLWQLRVLAGWQSRSGVHVVRLLASGFEISNAEAHIQHIEGNTGESVAYRLGALRTAWPRLSRTRSLEEMRTELARSPWGDPGSGTPAAIATGMRIAAVERIAVDVPPAAAWARMRAALLVAREEFVLGRHLTAAAGRRAAFLLGPSALRADSWAEYRSSLPSATRAVLDGVRLPADLWKAEARWWSVIESQGRDLLRSGRPGIGAVVGVVALLSADARRARGALALSAVGGFRPEVLDAPV